MVRIIRRLLTASAKTFTGTSKRFAAPSSFELSLDADFTEPDWVVVLDVEVLEEEEENNSLLPVDDEELEVEVVKVSPSTGNITASALTSSSAFPFNML